MNSARQPVAFLGHGSPMNALEVNPYSVAWREFGAHLAVPRAVLMVSAHWYTNGIGVTAMAHPPTIHDFGGFPPELFAVQYPAPGSPELADEVVALLAGAPDASVDGTPIPVALGQQWGLDHGAWSVLVHVFPNADVPVVQLSIDARQPAGSHWELGRRLRPLRDNGVLILGSGNITHNFAELDYSATGAAPWAVEFDEHIWAAVQSGDRGALVGFAQHRFGRRAVPTPDHYLPMLYVAGAAHEGEAARTIVTGMDLGSFSMRSFAIG